ncbi:MAG: 50S ribosomal protein L18 [Pseudomonadota bacterium]
MITSIELRQRRKQRQRTKIRLVSAGRLRLSVHRTNQHMYAQIIDDKNSVTLASASTLSKEVKAAVKSGGTKEAATLVGKILATIAQKKGITEVVFDRSGFIYHGRIQALAESAREHGLVF